jgi:hypothetical protein
LYLDFSLMMLFNQKTSKEQLIFNGVFWIY